MASPIQQKVANGTTGATLTFTSSVTAGSAIVLSAATSSTSTAFTVSDNLGNTYTKAISQATGTGTKPLLELWYAYNVTGGSCTITIGGGTSATVVAANEYPSLGTTDPLDKTAGADGSGTAIASNNPATTTQADELIVGAAAYRATRTFTAGSGFGNELDTTRTNGATSVSVGIEDKTVSSTGVYSSTFTGSGTGVWEAVVATFKIPSAPTTNTTNFFNFM